MRVGGLGRAEPVERSRGEPQAASAGAEGWARGHGAETCRSAGVLLLVGASAVPDLSRVPTHHAPQGFARAGMEAHAGRYGAMHEG
jgi:hypothetical protein